MHINRNTGEVWINEYYDLGHNSYTAYDDPAIINLIRGYDELNSDEDDTVDGCKIESVTKAAEKLCDDWNK